MAGRREGESKAINAKHTNLSSICFNERSAILPVNLSPEWQHSNGDFFLKLDFNPLVTVSIVRGER
jgi:hypothetical protein